MDVEVIRWFGIGVLLCILAPLVACDLIQRAQDRREERGVRSHGR